MSSNKYIKRFDTESEYDEFRYSNEYIRPNLSYVDETDNLHINELDCLKFIAKESNSTVKLTRVGSSSSLTNVVLQYSTDGLTWNNYPLNTVITLSNINNYVLFKGNNTRLGYDSNNYHQFVMTGKVAALGPISSLTSPDKQDKTLVSYMYYKLFYNCTSLTEAPELPATTLAEFCYKEMFSGCTSLTEAPMLPATTLVDSCYRNMFYGCTSLITAPELPATTLAQYCYVCMFEDCTSLITAPALPATTLARHCYGNMLRGCTSLTTAPALPATTLAYGCYVDMFHDCTSLTTAPSLPATTLTNYCYGGLFMNCTSLTTAPDLPATNLAANCYVEMFSGCTNLNYIKAMFITTPSATYTSNWVNGVASTGTFIKNSAAEWNVIGANGIPSDWTIEYAAA